MIKSYHPLHVFLRYFSIGFWLPDVQTGFGRISYVRTPLGMVHIEWERVAIQYDFNKAIRWRISGVVIGLFWAPLRWDYRIGHGSLLFRHERRFSWSRPRLV